MFISHGILPTNELLLDVALDDDFAELLLDFAEELLDLALELLDFTFALELLLFLTEDEDFAFELLEPSQSSQADEESPLGRVAKSLLSSSPQATITAKTSINGTKLANFFHKAFLSQNKLLQNIDKVNLRQFSAIHFLSFYT